MPTLSNRMLEIFNNSKRFQYNWTSNSQIFYPSTKNGFTVVPNSSSWSILKPLINFINTTVNAVNNKEQKKITMTSLILSSNYLHRTRWYQVKKTNIQNPNINLQVEKNSPKTGGSPNRENTKSPKSTKNNKISNIPPCPHNYSNWTKAK
jgi:predicted membrane GTPase involved in stress response